MNFDDGAATTTTAAGGTGSGWALAKFAGLLGLNGSIGGLSLLLLPIAMGAMGSTGLNETQLGAIGSVELGTLALVSLGIASRVDRLDPIKLMVCGAIVSAIANLLSGYLIEAPYQLLALRSLSGAGAGVMQVAGLALVARIANPERIYGIIWVAPAASAAVGYAATPYLMTTTNSAGGIFYFIGALSFISAVSLMLGRAAIRFYVAQHRLEGPRASCKKASDVPSGAGRVDWRILAFCLSSSALLALCDSLVWSYVAPISTLSGFTLVDITNVLIGGAIIGIFGSMFAGWMGVRFGILLPLGFGQGLMILLSLMLVSTHDPSVFVAGLYLRIFTILFLLPMYSGLYARMDTSGRVVAAANSVNVIAYAVGPVLGGQLISIESKQFLELGIVAASFGAFSLLLTFLLVARYNRAVAGELANPADAHIA